MPTTTKLSAITALAASPAATDTLTITRVSASNNARRITITELVGNLPNVNLASGNTYKINSTTVLSATALGSGVTASSLTSLGTLTSLDVTGNITVGGTVDGVDVAALQTDVDGFPDALKNLTAGEIGELENIGATTISATQWNYLGTMDQGVASGSNVTWGLIAGTLTTAAQGNITSLGTLTALTVSGVSAFAAGSAGTPSIIPSGDTNTGFWFPAADTVAVSTGGTERWRTISSGEFLYGTTSVLSYAFADWRTASNGKLFAITGPDTVGFAWRETGIGTPRQWRLSASNGDLYFNTSTNDFAASTNILIIDKSGHIYPGADNSYTCGTSGNRWSDIYAASGSVNTSDAREKKDIEASDLGTDFIKRLNPVKFQYVWGQRPHYGFVAQEIEAVMQTLGKDFAGLIHSEWTEKDEDGNEVSKDIYGLRYAEFIGPIVACLQDLIARVEALEIA